MTIAHPLLSFVLAAGLMTITPGLDTAIVLRTATTEGAARAVQVAFGVVMGCLIWGGAVALGLGALIAQSEVAFTVLKWLGVGYLAWMGLQLILHPRTGFSTAATSGSRLDGGRSNWFWKGMAQNLLNPKVGVFYVSFLPQFVPPDVSVAPYTFLLAAIHGALGLAWFAALLVATRPLVRVLQRPSVIRMLDRLTGIVFIGFGVKLALSRR
ncbi:MAG TPA: LysE family translocator [Aliidongia sp.]|uniref:LysE family translocator n=1 Tax=Aliidongia sp. TaxID=1914230 RepID=UPI002DDD7B4B|nr:LysE family translocator [Aliidongia sp.]HEV2672933.1 LysE family translocator [Aliidongia sp.]